MDRTNVVGVVWDYCPECGSQDVRHEEGAHKQCADCFQEWFSDMDYSGTVRFNLMLLHRVRKALKL